MKMAFQVEIDRNELWAVTIDWRAALGKCFEAGSPFLQQMP
jgi:hypothetical protein